MRGVPSLQLTRHDTVMAGPAPPLERAAIPYSLLLWYQDIVITGPSTPWLRQQSSLRVHVCLCMKIVGRLLVHILSAARAAWGELTSCPHAVACAVWGGLAAQAPLTLCCPRRAVDQHVGHFDSIAVSWQLSLHKWSGGAAALRGFIDSGIIVLRMGWSLL